ncbi:MAG: hypothetical protein ISR76_01235 [Planctomycetes bacterium]|nr:hypothetical protein [Planctomycetota bacterium]
MSKTPQSPSASPAAEIGTLGSPFVVDAFPDPEAPPASRAAPPPRLGPMGHLAAGFGDVLCRPRVLVFLIAVAVLAALPAALPVFRSAHLNLAPVVEPAAGPGLSLEGLAPDWLFADWKLRDPSLQALVGDLMAPAVLLSSWFGLLVCGGWMGLARAGRRGHGLSVFLAAGGRAFFPFLRTWFLGLPLFYAATWLVWGPPGEWLMGLLLPGGDAARATSETAANWVTGSRELLSLFLVLGIEVLLDLGRASLVAGQRRSALLALLRGFGYFLFEPLRVWGLVGAGLAFELLWLAAMSSLVAQGLLPLWALVLLLPFGRIVCRGARYAGLLRLYAEGRPERPVRRAGAPPSPSRHASA